MRAKKKVTVMVASALLSIFILATGIFIFNKNAPDVRKENLPISYLRASFTIDPYNLNELIGDSDYVFIGTVKEEVGTIYKDMVTIETENGSKKIGDPYTRYSLIVSENIKGNLITDSEIEVLKAGGIGQDKDFIYMYENDQLLETGESYIITAYAQPDGSLLISGPNSSKQLNLKTKSTSSDYRNYLEGYENQVETTRKRFNSIYEK